jgi:hypothetical protein
MPRSYVVKGGDTMLKSELVISKDLDLLNSHLMHYSIRFLSPIFSDQKSSGQAGYEEERAKMRALVNSNSSKARSTLVEPMMHERDLFPVIRDIFYKNEGWNIDPLVVQNTLTQMDRLKNIIEEWLLAERVTTNMLEKYYENSLLLLIYFNAVRSYIVTLKAIRAQFELDVPVCRLRFESTIGESFTIDQQREILGFLEFIFTQFSEDYSEILSVNIDTGSPLLGVDIKVKLETSADLTKIFSDFFQYVQSRDKANSIRSMRAINAEVKRIKKEKLKELKAVKDDISQEEYVNQFSKIVQWEDNLQLENIQMAIANNNVIKKLELKYPRVPLQIENIENSSGNGNIPQLPEPPK